MSVEAPAWNKPERMTHVELMSEVFRLRELVQAKEDKAIRRMRLRLVELEARDRERAAHLKKANNQNRILLKRVQHEQDMRAAAEKNSARWHALLLQEKVRNLPERTT